MARYDVPYTPSADKALRKLPKSTQVRIATTTDELGDNPRPRGCKKLKGEDDLWRIRVGDYRIVYTIEDDQLIILAVRVAHRKDVYQG
ncbi:MAG: type II toxin-antitoxin system RelE/ParE family toxin [Planctomycetes bacterium]|jgi:mRNA interferase RelE/StbE|nr:type II toxin-antitoxin system RelE/ParE family toxin [Planctomycetota bacterium]